MVNHCDMEDLPSSEVHFAWHMNCRGHRLVAKKLDRVIANLAWRPVFPEAFIKVLYRFHSDHNMLLLRSGGSPDV